MAYEEPPRGPTYVNEGGYGAGMIVGIIVAIIIIALVAWYLLTPHTAVAPTPAGTTGSAPTAVINPAPGTSGGATAPSTGSGTSATSGSTSTGSASGSASGAVSGSGTTSSSSGASATKTP